ELNRIAGVDKVCSFVKVSISIYSLQPYVELVDDSPLGDFMKMPFPDNSFDAVYAIEATCHAPDPVRFPFSLLVLCLVGCYKEIYRVLKPGQCFAAYEWCMTDSYDPSNQTHQKIKVRKISERLDLLLSSILYDSVSGNTEQGMVFESQAEIEIGNGLPDIRLTTKCLEAVKEAGFEVEWEKDLAQDSHIPWYQPLDSRRISFDNFRTTFIGRFFTRKLVVALEYVGIAPKGSQRVQAFLEQAADGLVEGARWVMLLLSISYKDM
ncbi:Sterol methyltransferase C-terminal, partial [Dillenia turbinata]